MLSLPQESPARASYTPQIAGQLFPRLPASALFFSRSPYTAERRASECFSTGVAHRSRHRLPRPERARAAATKRAEGRSETELQPDPSLQREGCSLAPSSLLGTIINDE